MPVVDANVIIHGRSEAAFKNALTVPEVIEELKSTDASAKGDLMDLEICKPKKKFVDRVKKKAEVINSKASETDQKVLALALEKNEEMVTDDKELQNLGLHLDVDVEGFLDKPTKEKMSWVLRCSNCGSNVKDLPCSRCGGQKVQRKRD